MSYKPSIGPMNRPPPWRRQGFHSFQGMGQYVERPGFHAEYAAAGMGSYVESPGFDYEYATAGLGVPDDEPSSLTKPTRDIQQMLIARGFSVGSAGADGKWGRNSQNGLNLAVGRTVPVTVSGAYPNQTVTLAYSAALALESARASGGSTTGGGGSTTGGGTTSGGGSTIGPNTLPDGDDSLLDGGGMDWGKIWPWAAGAGAFLALGGAFLYMGSKKKRRGGAALGAPVTANKRRRRRRSTRRRSTRRR